MGGLCYSCMRRLEKPDLICPLCGHNPHPESKPHQLAPGTFLRSRYLLGRALGQGGFGITYIGLDTLLQNRVAIKEFYPAGYANRLSEASPTVTYATGRAAAAIAKSKERFLDEARVLARLDGTRGVVGVKDFFESNATAYIVMEYLEGEDLQRYLQHTVLSADEVFARFEPIMDALSAVHERGIIHRDISPENIKVTGGGSLRLMDFGAARAVELDSTRSVSVMLKVGYAPEEQYRPKGRLGPWTDIYALCATMYKCITGIAPDDSLQRITSDSGNDPLAWPSELGIEISKRQEDTLRRGMALRARDRFQSIAEMQAFLRGEAPQDSQIDRAPASYNNTASSGQERGAITFVRRDPADRRRKRSRRAILTAGAITACVIAVGVSVSAFGNHGNTGQAVAHARPTVTATAYEGTYDGKAHSARISATGDSKTDVYYSEQPLSFDGYQQAIASGIASDKAITRTAAGKTQIYYLAVCNPEGGAMPSAENCASGSTSIRISKAAQTIRLPKKSYSKTTASRSFNLKARARGKLNYSSNRTDVAKVSKTGTVSMIGPGMAKITVTAAATKNYRGARASVRVKVAQATPAQAPASPIADTTTAQSEASGSGSNSPSSGRRAETGSDDSVDIDGWI